MPVNLEPVTTRTAALVRGVRDDQLDQPTPCGISVGELLYHLQSLAHAFTIAATKAVDEMRDAPPPTPDADNLGDDWRDRIPTPLDALAVAWAEPEAWAGMTKAGGLELPGEVAGVIALDEVVLHGWDLAVATGQSFEVADDQLEPLVPFLAHVAEPGMEAGREGLFGPVVPVPDDASLFDRILGLAGRDPGWSA
jgi:uncharacterized protein (TIGR03086 family)